RISVQALLAQLYRLPIAGSMFGALSGTRKLGLVVGSEWGEIFTYASFEKIKLLREPCAFIVSAFLVAETVVEGGKRGSLHITIAARKLNQVKISIGQSSPM
ncbi:MAG: hypothetical protein ABJZ69_11300, partial [Hyphomicrobiales bacterium]